MAEDPLDFTSVRAFLAIPLEDIFHEELDGLLRSLSRQMPGVRWVESVQAHLTLHFFGNISILQVERIDTSMRIIANLYRPLDLTLSGLGGFPDLNKPDILWLAVQERTGELLSFRKAIKDELRCFGFEAEARAFLPHVTIKRVKMIRGDINPFMAKIHLELPAPEKTADHFVLYQSHRLPKGARYEILKTYPLSKKI